MAIAVFGDSPGGTAEVDESIQRQMNLAENRPAGVLLRLAGPTENGWRVFTVWETQEAFESFRRERLEPAFRQLGIPVPQFQMWPLHSVFIAPQQA